jgi:hypothetical protein
MYHICVGFINTRDRLNIFVGDGILLLLVRFIEKPLRCIVRYVGIT